MNKIGALRERAKGATKTEKWEEAAELVGLSADEGALLARTPAARAARHAARVEEARRVFAEHCTEWGVAPAALLLLGLVGCGGRGLRGRAYGGGKYAAALPGVPNPAWIEAWEEAAISVTDGVAPRRRDRMQLRREWRLRACFDGVRDLRYLRPDPWAQEGTPALVGERGLHTKFPFLALSGAEVWGRHVVAFWTLLRDSAIAAAEGEDLRGVADGLLRVAVDADGEASEWLSWGEAAALGAPQPPEGRGYKAPPERYREWLARELAAPRSVRAPVLEEPSEVSFQARKEASGYVGARVRVRVPVPGNSEQYAWLTLAEGEGEDDLKAYAGLTFVPDAE